MRKKVEQLRISYFRDKVKTSLDIRRFTWKRRGRPEEVITLYTDNKHRSTHAVGTKTGQELLALYEECENYKRILSILESEWLGRYGTPCGPMKIKHYKDTDNRRRFDELEERRLSYQTETSVFYKGREYRSKLEADFASIMDEYGILYKYEPAIMVDGNAFLFPDFVIYLPWLDLLVLVEIFGKCSDEQYLYDNRLKIYKYMNAGWTPGHDMLMFFYTDRTPYIREMIMEEIEIIEIRRCYSLLKSSQRK